MLRIVLFLGTNISVLLVLSVAFSLLGFDSLLAQNGVDLNLGALLAYSAILGFSGALVSLFLSKWMAKRSMGVRVITQPSSELEQWLVHTVGPAST